jgi:hypothetical protein
MYLNERDRILGLLASFMMETYIPTYYTEADETVLANFRARKAVSSV